jgi:hypothetical protein
VEATKTPVASPQATPRAQKTKTPTSPSKPEIEPSPDTTGGQPIVNMVKFWDAVVVTLAYPWLCCGIGLMLLTPIVLLYLEIKGRRPPPTPPEPVPTEPDGESVE